MLNYKHMFVDAYVVRCNITDACYAIDACCVDASVVCIKEQMCPSIYASMIYFRHEL